MKRILFYASAIAVMFSSCSKDTTEAIAPEASRLNVFKAEITAESHDLNSTRMSLSGDGKSYVWAIGDAIGVSSPDALDANIPSYNLSDNSVSATFAVDNNDARYFGDWDKNGDALYFYFPYSSTCPLTPYANGVSALLNIPKTQRYIENGFFKNTVPAVGYVEKYVIGETAVKLSVPVSMLKLNVKGYGHDVESFKLKIKKPSSDEYYGLSGNVVVLIPTDGSVATASEGSIEQPSQEIVMTFGNEPADMHYTNSRALTFVIPTGIELNGATIELYTDKGEMQDLLIDFLQEGMDNVEKVDGQLSAKTQPNYCLALTSSKFHFTFGMDGKFVIEDDANATDAYGDGYNAEEKFIAYAYLTQVGQTDDQGNPTELGSTVSNSGALYPALIAEGWMTSHTDIAWIKTKTLDFNGYNKAWADAKYNDVLLALQGSGAADLTNDQKEIALMWQRIYKWYSDNEAGINSLGYNAIAGDGVSAKQVAIKNLKVVGTGLSAGASLKNLVLDNLTVKATGEAGIIAGINTVNSYVSPELTVGAKFENVTINGGLVEAETALLGGIYARYVASKEGDSVNVTEAPKVESAGVTGAMYAAYTAKAGANVIDLTNNVFEWSENQALINSIAGSYAVVEFKGVDETKLVAGDVYGGIINGVGVTNHSVIINKTAYWSGIAAASVNNDGIYTAEEFAYDLTHAATVSRVLSHNIDMQMTAETDAIEGINGSHKAVSLTADEEEPKTISNVVYGGTSAGSYTTLLGGKNVTIENVNFSNIVVNGNGGFATAGLAASGKALNVSVNNLTLNAKEANYSDNYPSYTVKDLAGAIFAEVSVEDLKSVSVKKVSLNVPASTTVGAVAGRLVLPTGNNDYVLSGVKVLSAPSFSNSSSASTNRWVSSEASKIETYKTGKLGASTSKDDWTAFGALYVDCAQWGTANAPVVQSLKNDTENPSQIKRIAARFIFPDSILDSAVDNAVKYGDGVDASCAYKFSYDPAWRPTTAVKFGFVYNSAN